MDMQTEVAIIKHELITLIVTHLKENKIEIATARKLAGDFLAILPVRDQQDLLLKLKNLGTEYSEARVLYVQELGKVTEAKRHQALSQMHELLKQGNIEQAIAVAKAVKNA